MTNFANQKMSTRPNSATPPVPPRSLRLLRRLRSPPGLTRVRPLPVHSVLLHTDPGRPLLAYVRVGTRLAAVRAKRPRVDTGTA